MYDVLNESFDKYTGCLTSTLHVWSNNNDIVIKYIAEYLDDKSFIGYVYNPTLGSTIDVLCRVIDNNIYINVVACYVRITRNINKITNTIRQNFDSSTTE